MYTMDALHDAWRNDRAPKPQDIPTLDYLRSHRTHFPVEALQGKTNALCLISAWFCGRSDIIHVLDAGVQKALVAGPAPAMEVMRQLYPASWDYWSGGYQEFLASSNNRRFDLVIADQPRPYARDVAISCVPALARLCTQRFTLIVNYWAEAVAELGVDRADLPGLSRALTERVGINTKFVRMTPRSDVADWAIIDIDQPEPDALLRSECEPSAEAVKAGARALRAWERGGDWFDVDGGARKVWLEMALVEKRQQALKGTIAD